MTNDLADSCKEEPCFLPFWKVIIWANHCYSLTSVPFPKHHLGVRSIKVALAQQDPTNWYMTYASASWSWKLLTRGPRCVLMHPLSQTGLEHRLQLFCTESNCRFAGSFCFEGTWQAMLSGLTKLLQSYLLALLSEVESCELIHLQTMSPRRNAYRIGNESPKV